MQPCSASSRNDHKVGTGSWGVTWRMGWGRSPCSSKFLYPTLHPFHVSFLPSCLFEPLALVLGKWLDSHCVIHAGVSITCWNARPSAKQCKDLFCQGCFSGPPLPLINFSRGCLSFFSLVQCPSNLFFPPGLLPKHNLISRLLGFFLALVICSVPVLHVFAGSCVLATLSDPPFKDPPMHGRTLQKYYRIKDSSGEPESVSGLVLEWGRFRTPQGTGKKSEGQFFSCLDSFELLLFYWFPRPLKIGSIDKPRFRVQAVKRSWA